MYVYVSVCEGNTHTHTHHTHHTHTSHHTHYISQPPSLLPHHQIPTGRTSQVDAGVCVVQPAARSTGRQEDGGEPKAQRHACPPAPTKPAPNTATATTAPAPPPPRPWCCAHRAWQAFSLAVPTTIAGAAAPTAPATAGLDGRSSRRAPEPLVVASPAPQHAPHTRGPQQRGLRGWRAGARGEGWQRWQRHGGGKEKQPRQRCDARQGF